MSQAEELLNNLSSEDITLFSVNPTIEEHIVIDDERYISVPEPLKRIAVQHDHNVETVTFDCPRYWDNHDLSDMYIYINYMRSDRVKGRYLAKNVRIDTNDLKTLHFEWTIGNEITDVNGNIAFLVCAVKTDTEGNEEIHWNSEINNQMFISNGLECTESVINMYPDIINELLSKTNTLMISNSSVTDKTLTQPGLAADAKYTGIAINNLSNEINARTNGSPTPVSSVGDMTDTSRAYLNVTDGNWYYYDGSKWTIGGPYQLPQSGETVTDLESRIMLLEGKRVIQTTIVGDVITETYDDNSYKVTTIDFKTVNANKTIEKWYSSDNVLLLTKTSTFTKNSVAEVLT